MAPMGHTDRDCPNHEAELSALLDGELAAPEAAAVEARLRACPACAALARDLSGVSRLLRSWDAGEPPVAVSAGFRSRVLSAVAGERAGRRDGTGTAGRGASPAPLLVPGASALRLLRWAPAAAAAAAVLAVVGGTAALLSGTTTVPSPKSPFLRGLPGEPAPTASSLLDAAAEHRAAGRSDLEQRSVLAAWGLSPEDPAVRAAFARSLGYDPAGLERSLDGKFPSTVPARSGAGGGGVALLSPADAEEADFRDFWAGPCRFSHPMAYNRFLEYREHSRDLEVAQAARTEALPPPLVTVAEERAAPEAGHPLSRALASLTVGTPLGGNGSATWGGLVVYPLRRTPGTAEGLLPASDEPLSLEEALASRRVEVRDNQVRSAGTVLVSNQDPERPLLLLAGEVLVGGRADRMVARDVLVPSGQRHFPVPVYEVEAGRGSNHPFGSRFREAPGLAGARLRGLAIAGASGEEVTSYVRERLDLLDVTSSRRSLADAFSDRGPAAPVLRTVVKPQVADLLRGLQEESVVGFAVAQGTDLLCVEVFGSHRLMLRHARRVLEGAALESSTYAGGGRPPLPSDVHAMLEAAGRGTSFQGGTAAMTEVGVLALEGGLLGSGVLRGGRVLHATVLRGAGSGALAGRGARSGDLPGGGPAPSGGGTPGGPPPEGGESGGEDPSTAGGTDPTRPPDSSPTRDRPK